MGHWYSSDGTPTYKIKGANGKLRDTTLRDARKLNLVPSVTTIMSVEDKPGLLIWKQAQLLKACMMYPYDEEIYDEDFWKKKVTMESELIGKNAADKGTIIHNALEDFYKKGSYEDIEDFSPIPATGFNCKYYKLSDFINPVIEFMNERFPDVDWIPEGSFSSPLGFGGKVDMHSKGKPGQKPIVLDYKTKDTDDRKKLIAYDQHHMQTAAYANGYEIENAERYNLFISTHVPGMYELTESTDFEREFGMFTSLLSFWQLKNKYVPEI